ncbi:MAG: ABC transporter substrate-binding protein [Alphaproteobacteria bacterium]|nr:ABC transporter substrate-binding protein [Alphaproteobacteria bacterium]
MRVLKMLAIGAVLALTPAVWADKKSEAFVASNADSVLKVLNDASLSSSERRVRFSEYMHKFAYVPDIARRVLGPEGRSLSKEEFDRYYKTFEAYAIAVYEVQLDQFRGEAIQVTGSKDDDARRSTVFSVIKSTDSGKDINVQWDVLASQDGKTYRVRDVGIDINNSVLWLAQDQQAQFSKFLGRNNGDVDKLIVRINQMIADMAARKKSGTGSTLGKVSRGGARPG